MAPQLPPGRARIDALLSSVGVCLPECWPQRLARIDMAERPSPTASEQRLGSELAARPKRGAQAVASTPRSAQLGESLQKHESMVRKLRESAEAWEQKM